MTYGQFAIDDNDNSGILGRNERPVDDQGVAFVDAMINHAISLDLNEEGSSGGLDKVFIKAKVGDGTDDSEHGPTVS